MRARSLRFAAVAGLTAALMGGAVAARQQPGVPAATRPVNESDDPILREFRFRSIGPAVMGGRVNDVEGDLNDPMSLYVAFATGGLWKTTNGGITWASLFDEMPYTSIGDVGIAPTNGDIVYVGMGEANNRQSSSIGNGMYKTIDGGKTWTHLGLEDTQSISRVVVHPRDPNTVFVAAMGHLYAGNPERGLYKTTDGGKTWKKSKFIDNYTGFADVAIDPVNPSNVYATSYQRLRTWWGYNGGGASSGLWKSTDGGDSWARLQGNGLPEPDDKLWGRSGIGIHRANPSILYAIIESGASGGTGANVAEDGGPIEPTQGGGRGAQAAPNPKKSGVWRSNDAGKTWTFLSNVNDRPMYYSQIIVHPTNPDIVVQGGATAQRSIDGGKTWSPIRGTGHGDYHSFWFNPKEPRMLWAGHDGGLDISHDTGVTWDYLNNMALGQFYQLSADMRRPYHVCGGLQDNGSWCGPSAVRSGQGPLNTDWYRTGGGDGFYTRQDPTDWTVLYTESQNGAVSRYDLRNGTSRSIRPRARGAAGGRGGGGASNIVNEPAAGTEFRFNWNAPIEMSPHDPNTIFYGAQYFFRSSNRGDTWWMNGKDLTNNVDRFAHPIMDVPGRAPMASKHDGYANNSNIVIIRESPSKPGVLWVGTDDGNLQVSTDAGMTFVNVIGNIKGGPRVTGPMDQVQISRIEPSNFDPATAYVSLDNHRNNDWKPYLFKTADYGKTWTPVSGDLPVKGHINAIEEDYVNPNLMFVGTEFGLFVTLDGGRTYKKFSTGLPSVRIDDLLIHPRDGDLLVATHGRSFWIADDITPLQQLGRAAPGTARVFDPRPSVQWKNDTMMARSVTAKQFRGQNPQGGATISFWTAEAGDAKIEILDQTGRTIRTLTAPSKTGLNRVQWDMRPDAAQGQGQGQGQQGAGRQGGQQQQAATPATPAQTAQQQQAAQANAAAQAAAQFGGGRRGGGGGGVPFVSGGGPQMAAPGTYMVRVTVGTQTLTTSVVLLEDVWMQR
ncbi:MAG: hypothetical protein M3R55_07990 [Acidobacteriota bacterium]|nr:hypothetical protein [Acidobacteriota bacterium]